MLLRKRAGKKRETERSAPEESKGGRWAWALEFVDLFACLFEFAEWRSREWEREWRQQIRQLQKYFGLSGKWASTQHHSLFGLVALGSGSITFVRCYQGSPSPLSNCCSHSLFHCSSTITLLFPPCVEQRSPPARHPYIYRHTARIISSQSLLWPFYLPYLLLMRSVSNNKAPPRNLMGTQTPKLFLWYWAPILRTWRTSSSHLDFGGVYITLYCTCRVVRVDRKIVIKSPTTLYSPCCKPISPQCAFFCLLVIARSLLPLTFFLIWWYQLDKEQQQRDAWESSLYYTYFKVRDRVESKRVNEDDGEDIVLRE